MAPSNINDVPPNQVVYEENAADLSALSPVIEAEDDGVGGNMSNSSQWIADNAIEEQDLMEPSLGDINSFHSD